MQLLDLENVGSNHISVASGNEEPYPHWIQYRAWSIEGEHRVRIGFSTRTTYGQPGKRIVVWITITPTQNLWPLTTLTAPAMSCLKSRFPAPRVNASVIVLYNPSAPMDVDMRLCDLLRDGPPASAAVPSAEGQNDRRRGRPRFTGPSAGGTRIDGRFGLNCSSKSSSVGESRTRRCGNP
jgi:hypothetical protein